MGYALLTEIIEVLLVSSVSVLKRGDVGTEIFESLRFQNLSLVFAGSRGLNAVNGWILGSVSYKLAQCRVLMVKELGGVFA